MKVEVRSATLSDAAYVADNMREDDRLEVWASSRSDATTAVLRSVSVSTHAWVGYYDGRPVCVFGVAPLSMVSGEGTPWLLGTDELVRRPRAFLRRCHRYVAEMLAVYPILTNYVHDGNEASKAWLGWLGFTLHDPAPHGPDKAMFRKFEMRADHV